MKKGVTNDYLVQQLEEAWKENSELRERLEKIFDTEAVPVEEAQRAILAQICSSRRYVSSIGEEVLKLAQAYVLLDECRTRRGSEEKKERAESARA